MQADHDMLRTEARTVARKALQQYDNAEHVLLYAASRALVWQELNSRARMHPRKLSDAIQSVDNHLRHEVQRYLYE